MKALENAKQRLKALLGPLRQEFTLAMLKDVLNALAESSSVAGVVVVTPDRRVAALAEHRGLKVVEESPCRGLNAAIAQGIEAVRGLGGRRAVVLPADIPLVTGAELDRLAAELQQESGRSGGPAVGIGSSKDGEGTNCLFLSVTQPFAFHYGPGSFKVHRASAEAGGQEVFSLYSDTIALDVDEPRHLDELLAFCADNPQFQKTETWHFLHCNMRLRSEAERA